MKNAYIKIYKIMVCTNAKERWQQFWQPPGQLFIEPIYDRECETDASNNIEYNDEVLKLPGMLAFFSSKFKLSPCNWFLLSNLGRLHRIFKIAGKN